MNEKELKNQINRMDNLIEIATKLKEGFVKELSELGSEDPWVTPTDEDAAQWPRIECEYFYGNWRPGLLIAVIKEEDNKFICIPIEGKYAYHYPNCRIRKSQTVSARREGN